MTGAGSLPSEWIDPLNDTRESAIFGFATNSISDLAGRTVEVSKEVGWKPAARELPSSDEGGLIH